MKTLKLIITQKYFDQIVAGTKKKEYREVKPTTIKRLLQLDSEGFEVEDNKGNAIPIKYNRIQFYVGYHKDRDTCIVEVKDSHCELLTDETDEPIYYEHGGLTWVKEQVVYNLGRITYCNNNKYHYDRLNDPLCYPDIAETENDKMLIRKATNAPLWDSCLNAEKCDSRKAFEFIKNLQIRNNHYEEANIGEL
jgi:hypothetical protein